MIQKNQFNSNKHISTSQETIINSQDVLELKNSDGKTFKEKVNFYKNK